MNFLLDTHVLLWWLADHRSLSTLARRLVANRENAIYVSAASAWEIAIKRALGKLTAPNDLEQAIEEAGFENLPIRISHALLVEKLPPLHQDPFDRLLIAQAQAEGIQLLTQDPRLGAYGKTVALCR